MQKVQRIVLTWPKAHVGLAVRSSRASLKPVVVLAMRAGKATAELERKKELQAGATFREPS